MAGKHERHLGGSLASVLLQMGACEQSQKRIALPEMAVCLCLAGQSCLLAFAFIEQVAMCRRRTVRETVSPRPSTLPTGR